MSVDLRVIKTRENIQNQMIRLLETVPFEIYCKAGTS